MKVSRKVGRRNHSSISRRRLRNKKTKSGYRKKNAKTQKGGKRGARSRKYGHKRGKRFHRGGFNCNIALMPLYRLRDGKIIINQSDDSRVRRRYFSTNTPTIYYTKVGSRFAMEDHSEFTMYVDFITTDDNVDLVIVFIRDAHDDNSPTFVFEIKGTTQEINNFLENMPKLLRDKLQTESNTKYSLLNNTLEKKNNLSSHLRVYSFKSSKNEDTFTEIANCIKSKIPGVADIIPKNVISPTIIKDDIEEKNDEDPQMQPRLPIPPITASE
jgi:hypothetical protein